MDETKLSRIVGKSGGSGPDAFWTGRISEHLWHVEAMLEDENLQARFAAIAFPDRGRPRLPDLIEMLPDVRRSQPGLADYADACLRAAIWTARSGVGVEIQAARFYLHDALPRQAGNGTGVDSLLAGFAKKMAKPGAPVRLSEYGDAAAPALAAIARAMERTEAEHAMENAVLAWALDALKQAETLVKMLSPQDRNQKEESTP